MRISVLRPPNFHVAILVVLFSLLCVMTGCTETVPSLFWQEHWRMVGHLIGPEHTGREREDWIAVFNFPDNGEIVQLVSDQVLAPDGWKPVTLYDVAYNEDAGVLVCVALRYYPSEPRNRSEIWLYDLNTQRSKWIGRRWLGASHFAWSGDGHRLAFLATEIPVRREPRRAGVYVYDLQTETLTELADDGLVSYEPGQTGAPVWSDDGKFLYYASVDRYAMRIELATGHKESFAVPAISILAVNGDEIIYRTQPKQRGLGGEESIYKVKWGDSKTTLLYRGTWFVEMLVSPSRRFIMVTDRISYSGTKYILIDTETCNTYSGMGRYFPRNVDMFPRTSAFSRR